MEVTERSLKKKKKINNTKPGKNTEDKKAKINFFFEQRIIASQVF